MSHRAFLPPVCRLACVALAVMCALGLGPWPMPAQAQPLQTAPEPADWPALQPVQRQALQPLQELWPGLGHEERRHWLALAQNFGLMNAHERAVLQGRMRDWASLSPQQRMKARLNYEDARHLSANEKRAKWQAYQSLAPEQRRQLAREGARQPVGAAPALGDVAHKSRAMPMPIAPAGAGHMPAAHLNGNTLLPEAGPPYQPPPQGPRR